MKLHNQELSWSHTLKNSEETILCIPHHRSERQRPIQIKCSLNIQLTQLFKDRKENPFTHHWSIPFIPTHTAFTCYRLYLIIMHPHSKHFTHVLKTMWPLNFIFFHWSNTNHSLFWNSGSHNSDFIFHLFENKKKLNKDAFSIS